MLRHAIMQYLQNVCGGRIRILTPSACDPALCRPVRRGYPLHSHLQTEIVQQIDGQARLKLSPRDAFDLQSDTPCLVTPGTIHAETFCRHNQPYHLLWIVLNTAGINFFISGYNPTEDFHVLPERQISPAINLTTLWTLTARPDLPSNPLARAEFQALMIQILLNTLSDMDNPTPDPDQHRARLVEQVRRYIEVHYREDVSLEELAQMARCSPNYLNGIFRKIAGRPIHQFVLEKRLDEAQRLLTDSTIPVKEVAYKMGFHDPLYFSRLFRKRFGAAPSKWTP